MPPKKQPSKSARNLFLIEAKLNPLYAVRETNTQFFKFCENLRSATPAKLLSDDLLNGLEKNVQGMTDSLDNTAEYVKELTTEAMRMEGTLPQLIIELTEKLKKMQPPKPKLYVPGPIPQNMEHLKEYRAATLETRKDTQNDMDTLTRQQQLAGMIESLSQLHDKMEIMKAAANAFSAQIQELSNNTKNTDLKINQLKWDAEEAAREQKINDEEKMEADRRAKEEEERRKKEEEERKRKEREDREEMERRRREEEERIRAEEERIRAEEERIRAEEERIRAEEEAIREEERRKIEEAERKRQEEEDAERQKKEQEIFEIEEAEKRKQEEEEAERQRIEYERLENERKEREEEERREQERKEIARKEELEKQKREKEEAERIKKENERLERERKENEERERREREKEKQEEERKRNDQNNWPLYTYELEADELDVGGVGMYARARADRFQKGSLRVSLQPDPADRPSAGGDRRGSEPWGPCGPGTVQLGRRVRIQTITGGKLTVQPRLLLYLPLWGVADGALRSTKIRELVVLTRRDEQDPWTPLPVEPRNVEGVPCAELSLQSVAPSAEYVAVQRVRVERLPPGGGVSAVDSRVKVVVPPGGLPSDTIIYVQIFVLPSGAVGGSPGVGAAGGEAGPSLPDLQHVTAATPVVAVRVETSQASAPTGPPPRLVLPRPVAAEDNIQRRGKSAAATRPGGDAPVYAHLQRDGRQAVQDVIRDDLTEISLPLNHFNVTQQALVLQTDADSPPSAVAAQVASLTALASHTPVRFLVRQQSAAPSRLVIACCTAATTNTALSDLTQRGYNSEAAPSNQILAEDGQTFTVHVKDNIEFADVTSVRMRFHVAQGMTLSEHVIKVKDKFAQWAQEKYIGTAVVTTRGRDSSHRPITVCEASVFLPKEPRTKFKRSWFVSLPGPLTEGYLRQLAAHLDPADSERLGAALRVDRVRLQRILTHQADELMDSIVRDILITWYQTSPRIMDKVATLRAALEEINRPDLVSELSEHVTKHQQGAKLRKLFEQVVSDESGQSAARWRQLCENLNMTSSEVDQIEAKHGASPEKCLAEGLMKWQDKFESANVEDLINALRKTNLDSLAEKLSSLLSLQ